MSLLNDLIKNTAFEKKNKIANLKKLLADTDYKAIKFAEGSISEEEFAPTRTARQGWRDEINELEKDGE